MLKKNWPYAAAAFGVYVAAIVASNWLITHVGIPVRRYVPIPEG